VPAAETLSITLPADMVEIIRAKVDAGGYASSSEVVREAIGRWIERERHLATLEAAIDRGIAGIDRGGGMSSAEVRAMLLSGMDEDGHQAA
jgi:antitoxin ParD1/3/4